MILDIDNLLQGLFLKQKKIMILRLNGKKNIISFPGSFPAQKKF